jgi:Sec7-like guanine-nucleotide exchange factor
VAKFLLKPGLAKFAIGQYLGDAKTDPDIIKSFVDRFDFIGKPIDIAMREFFQHFLLPAEGK